MAGTMGRLSVGVTGLQTSQYSLNATAHNLMNTQTDGYTRQQVLLTDRTYHKLSTGEVYTNTVGLGVVTSQVLAVRDNFADISFRRESGRLSYYKAQYEAVSEIENYFGELEGKDVNSTINSLWLSLQELQKEPTSIVTRSSFIATSHAFLDRMKEIRQSLIDYQKNLNTNIKDQIERINDLANDIMDLNDKILTAEASKLENANDYRDARNLAIDELSGLVNTEVVNNADGTVEVYIEGRCLVTRGRTYQLEAVQVRTNEKYIRDFEFTSSADNFMMPVWKDDQEPLFNINRIPSMEANTDIGALKGLMMSRGYFVSNFTDVPNQPKKPVEADYDRPADYQAAMTQYETDHKDYIEKLKYYNTYVEPYTITKLEAQLDVMVNGIVTRINDTLCPNKEVTLSDGSKIKILDTEKAGIGMGEGNEFPGTELFVRNSVPRYEKKTVTLEDGTVADVQVYNEQNPDSFYSLYSMGNIDINPELLKNPSLLPLSRETGAEAQEVVDQLLDLWNSTFTTVSPNSMIECNFVDYYAGMMDDLADRGYTFNALAETEQQSVTDLDNLRQGVAGVSSDEELSNMIKFQHAYNASSRYINTVSEMIQWLIERLGS